MSAFNLDNPSLNTFVDGFLMPFKFIFRTSTYLDGIGRKIADWLIPGEESNNV